MRGIAKVVTAVAQATSRSAAGPETKGEIAALADTINDMTTRWRSSPTRSPASPARSAIEGKLGGQARVPGTAGTWRDLTDNVNQLAANLTTQVRAIAESPPPSPGATSRSIAVEAQGEIAALKDNINQMIANLRETTQKNTEQDWLKTNLARFLRMLQGSATWRRRPSSSSRAGPLVSRTRA